MSYCIQNDLFYDKVPLMHLFIEKLITQDFVWRHNFAITNVRYEKHGTQQEWCIAIETVTPQIA